MDSLTAALLGQMPVALGLAFVTHLMLKHLSQQKKAKAAAEPKPSRPPVIHRLNEDRPYIQGMGTFHVGDEHRWCCKCGTHLEVPEDGLKEWEEEFRTCFRCHMGHNKTAR